MVSNPSVVNLDNIKVQIYHGRSFDDIVMALNNYTHADTDKIMQLLLEKRHLAPIYGERTPLASEFEDYLVIDDIPDVLHLSLIHIYPGRLIPIVSVRQAIVFAVNNPAHEPAPGQAQRSNSYRSSSDILPDCVAPTASVTLIKSTVSPWNLPGIIGPPVITVSYTHLDVYKRQGIRYVQLNLLSSIIHEV